MITKKKRMRMRKIINTCILFLKSNPITLPFEEAINNKQKYNENENE